MKRLYALLALVLAAVFLFAACGGSPPEDMPDQLSGLSGASGNGSDAQVAMLAYAEQIDSPLGLQVWNTLKLFEGEMGVPCAQYRATPEDLSPTLELAVRGGADLVVLVGADMTEAMPAAQEQYPGVYFVLVEAPPDMPLLSNGAAIRFAYEQAGWLAGYAAVSDGMEKLAYFSGEDAAVRLYALGFVLGAQAAAEGTELYVEARPVDIDEEAYPAWPQRLAQVLESGTQVLLASDAALQREAMAAMRKEGMRVFATDAQNITMPNDAVLSALVFNPQQTLYDLLLEWRQGKFPGGQELLAGIANGGVSLDMNTASFDAFTVEAYNEALGMWSSGMLAAELGEAAQPNEEGRYPVPESLTLDNVGVVLPQGAVPTPQSGPQSGGEQSDGEQSGVESSEPTPGGASEPDGATG